MTALTKLEKSSGGPTRMPPIISTSSSFSDFQMDFGM